MYDVVVEKKKAQTHAPLSLLIASIKLCQHLSDPSSVSFVEAESATPYGSHNVGEEVVMARDQACLQDSHQYDCENTCAAAH